MKKTILQITCILALGTSILGCSSVEGDAKRAAQLQQEVREYNRQRNHSKARQCGKEASKIIREYENSDKSQEFHKAYSEYKKQYK